MRRSRLVCLLMFLSFLVFSAFAHADGIPGDPVMQVDDPTCGGPEQPQCPIVGDNTPFTFSANATGGGSTSFRVDPNGTAGIFSLDIETLGTFESTSDVKCLSNAFVNCQVSFLGNVTDIYLSKECSDCGGGFSPGTIFTIDLDNLVLNSDGNPICDPTTGICETTPGTGGWQANQSFTGVGDLPSAPTTPQIPSPEPASIFLLAAGTTALFGKKMILKR